MSTTSPYNGGKRLCLALELRHLLPSASGARARLNVMATYTSSDPDSPSSFCLPKGRELGCVPIAQVPCGSLGIAN
eukprot:scaffold44_cov411-Prasinococcus_capsulatus_cf.AAC.14